MYATEQVSRTRTRQQNQEQEQPQAQERWRPLWGEQEEKEYQIRRKEERLKKREEREKKEQLEREQEKEKKRLEQEQMKLKEEIEQEKKKQQELQLQLEQEKLKQEQLLKEKEKMKQEETEKIQSQKAQLELKKQSESEFESKKLKEKTRKFLEVDSATEKQVKVDAEEKIENRPYTEKAEEILAAVKNIMKEDVKKDEKTTIVEEKNKSDQCESASKRVDSLLTDAQNLLLDLNLKKSKTREAETEIETEIFFDAVSFLEPRIFQFDEQKETETSSTQAEIFKVSAPSFKIQQGEEQNLLKTIEIQSPEKNKRKKTIDTFGRTGGNSGEKRELKLEKYVTSPSFQFKKRAAAPEPEPEVSSISKLELKIPVEKMGNVSESRTKKMEPVQIVQLVEFPSQKKIGSSSRANWSKSKERNVHFIPGSVSEFEFETESESEPESASKLDSSECCPFLSFVLPCIFARLK